MHLFWLLPAVWFALRTLGFKRTHCLAEAGHFSVAASNDPATLARAQRCAELVAIAARHGLYRANCLHQALALCRLLRRQGLPAQTRIGVLPDSQLFSAHAWVELDGVALGPSIEGYRAFPDLYVSKTPLHWV